MMFGHAISIAFDSRLKDDPEGWQFTTLS